MTQVKTKNSNAILLMHCQDKKGLIAEITDFLRVNNGNILDLDEHVDRQDNTFFMRVEWDLESFAIPRESIGPIFAKALAEKYNMHWSLYFTDQKPRMALFVSNLSHCLYDILSRHQSGEWDIDIPVIISNHDVLAPVAERFGIPFHVVPVNKDNREDAEKKELEILKSYNVTFIVLARYMQIVSPFLISHYKNKIINIHHSFLPAFPGAKPYHSAYERGVKIIGATSHYVTEELDAGPIIKQDVTHVTHKDTVEDLVRKGKDLEKIVLSRAIYKHIQRMVLVYKNKTVIFD
jgi:formyltetrahydrofolate deformylase